jgi:hypothetical protein
MRVQIIVSPEVKVSAEAQAATLGYATLAAMLRVVAVGLARDYQQTNPNYSPAEAAQASTRTGIDHATPATTNLPPPDHFEHWPKYVSRDIHKTDPQLYRFYIENGIIN